jgi:hypothetical protein
MHSSTVPDLRGKKMMKDFARHELQFWRED